MKQESGTVVCDHHFCREMRELDSNRETCHTKVRCLVEILGHYGTVATRVAEAFSRLGKHGGVEK